MIRSLVAEGRTVVFSSHLLDEVERTCAAVAIVDRGTVIRQGPISELLAGTALILQIECSEPDRARTLLHDARLATTVDVENGGLAVTLPAGTPRHVVAETARVLVTAGIDVYRLQPTHTSFESWFLQVTSRLGDTQ
jgi:ABC-2 type transport system ATP-binding protein